MTGVASSGNSHTWGFMQRGPYKAETEDNSQWVYEHLHRCDEEENQDAAAEGGAAPLLLLRGEVLLELGVHEAQRHGVDLVILHSGRNIRRRVTDSGSENIHDRAVFFTNASIFPKKYGRGIGATRRGEEMTQNLSSQWCTFFLTSVSMYILFLTFAEFLSPEAPAAVVC